MGIYHEQIKSAALYSGNSQALSLQLEKQCDLKDLYASDHSLKLNCGGTSGAVHFDMDIQLSESEQSTCKSDQSSHVFNCFGQAVNCIRELPLVRSERREGSRFSRHMRSHSLDDIVVLTTNSFVDFKRSKTETGF